MYKNTIYTINTELNIALIRFINPSMDTDVSLSAFESNLSGSRLIWVWMILDPEQDFMFSISFGLLHGMLDSHMDLTLTWLCF